MEPLAWYRIVAPIVACIALGVIGVVCCNPRLRIATLGVVALVGYAMLQDQVSARLCPEYFTVFHPPIPGLTESDPTLLGIGWGFLGGWWGGLLMGYVLGLTATLGPRPPLSVRELVGPVLVLIGVVSAVVALTGVTVWVHAEAFNVSLDPGIASMLPPERHRGLFVVACYHLAAYVAATVGSIVLCLWAWRERGRRAKERAT